MSNIVVRDFALYSQVERETAVACETLALTPSGTLIAATIVHAPESVLAKLEARDQFFLADGKYHYHQRSQGSDDQQMEILRETPRGGNPTALFVGFASVFAINSPLYIFVLNSDASSGSWSSLALFGGIAISLGVFRSWYLRDPLRLKRREQVKLLTPVNKGGWGEGPSEKTLSTPTGMIILARSIAADIRSSPAWNHPTLESHHARLDLDRELSEIKAAAGALSVMRHDVLTLPPGEVDGQAGTVAQQWEQIHSTLTTSIIERLIALHRYRSRLQPLEKLLTAQANIRQMQQGYKNINDNLVHVALGANAVTELERVSTELTDVEANLSAQIDFLGRSSH